MKYDYEYCQLTNLIEVREIDFFLSGNIHQIICVKLIEKVIALCVMKKAKKSEEDLQQHKPRQNAPFAQYK